VTVCFQTKTSLLKRGFCRCVRACSMNGAAIECTQECVCLYVRQGVHKDLLASIALCSGPKVTCDL